MVWKAGQWPALRAGAAVFFEILGIPQSLGLTFATLAVSTFLLTTLDTCTRLTRFLLEELFEWRNARSRYFGTFLVLLLPSCAVFASYTTPSGEVLPVWQAIWPLFGATNQMLAALALITFVVFLKHRRVGLWLCGFAGGCYGADALGRSVSFSLSARPPSVCSVELH